VFAEAPLSTIYHFFSLPLTKYIIAVSLYFQLSLALKKDGDEGLWKVGIFMLKAATPAKKSGVKKKPATAGKKSAASKKEGTAHMRYKCRVSPPGTINERIQNYYQRR